MEDDYMMVIIPCIAEIAASDTPERVKKLRLGALSELQRYLHYYRAAWLYAEAALCHCRQEMPDDSFRHNQGGDAKASPTQLSAL